MRCLMSQNPLLSVLTSAKLGTSYTKRLSDAVSTNNNHQESGNHTSKLLPTDHIAPAHRHTIRRNLAPLDDLIPHDPKCGLGLP